MSKYKRGAFVHIFNSNPTQWEIDLRRIQDLPSLDHIEVWLEYIPKGEEGTTLRDLLSDTEVIIHGPFIHMSLVTHLKKLGDLSLKKCNEAVEFASMISAKVVTFHAGTYPVFETQETALERLAHRFSRFAALKAPLVTLENMPVSGGTTKQCLGRLEDLELLQTIIPSIRFTLDIGHCLQNGDDFESFLLKQISRIENIHLHDGKDGGRSHLRLGLGTLDLPKLVRLLRGVDFRKYVGLETISPEDTIASWTTWLDVEQANNL